MRVLLGFLAGVAAAWAALAIYQRVPPLGPIDAGDPALEDGYVNYDQNLGLWESRRAAPEVDPEALERAADANQLRYRSQHRAGLGALRVPPMRFEFP